MKISAGKNPKGTVANLVDRLKAYKKKLEKDPEMQKREVESQALEKSVTTTSSGTATGEGAANATAQNLALGQMWGSHEAPLGRGLARLYTGQTLFDIGNHRFADADRTLASRAMLAELVKRFPNKKRSEILALMERAQKQFIGPPKVDKNDEALLSLE
jgi:hypothetical protein